MLNASALVIGIDKYDLAEIPVLSGCVVDAFKATKWLLELGVPPDRIFLHVAKASGIPLSTMSRYGLRRRQAVRPTSEIFGSRLRSLLEPWLSRLLLRISRPADRNRVRRSSEQA